MNRSHLFYRAEALEHNGLLFIRTFISEILDWVWYYPISLQYPYLIETGLSEGVSSCEIYKVSSHSSNELLYINLITSLTKLAATSLHSLCTLNITCMYSGSEIQFIRPKGSSLVKSKGMKNNNKRMYTEDVIYMHINVFAGDDVWCVSTQPASASSHVTDPLLLWVDIRLIFGSQTVLPPTSSVLPPGCREEKKQQNTLERASRFSWPVVRSIMSQMAFSSFIPWAICVSAAVHDVISIMSEDAWPALIAA